MATTTFLDALVQETVLSTLHRGIIIFSQQIHLHPLRSIVAIFTP